MFKDEQKGYAVRWMTRSVMSFFFALFCLWIYRTMYPRPLVDYVTFILVVGMIMSIGIFIRFAYLYRSVSFK